MATKTQTVQLMLITTVKGQQVLTPVALQLKGIGTAAQAAIPPVTQLNNRLNSFGNAISKSISNIRGTIVGLGTAMAIIGTVQMFSSSIQQAVDFEREMANVNTLLIGTGISIEELKKGVIDLGGELGSSAEQAQALYQAFSAREFQTAGEALEFIAQTSAFAKANLADLGQSTRLIATIMNAFGKEAGSVSHIVDVMAQTVKVGVITGEELANSLGTVISTAALAKVSFEEISAAIAVLTSVGIPAQQATTALNQAMLAFIDPPKEAAKAAHDLGIELTAAALAERGLLGAMQDIGAIIDKNVTLTQSLFTETRAFKAAAALTGNQMEKFADQAALMKDGVEGINAEMLKLQQQSSSAKLEIAINNLNKSLDAFWQAVIQKVTPALIKLMENMTSFFNAVSSGSPETIEKLYQIRDAIIAIGAAYVLIKLPAIIAGFTTLWKVVAGTALGTVLTNAVFNFQAAAKGAISYAGALSMLGTQVGALLKTPVVGITIILYGAVKALEMLRLIAQLKDEAGDTALAQSRAGDSAFKLAKQLNGLGVEIKWHLLNEPKYVEALIRKAQSIRQADSHVGAYKKSLEGANEANKKFGGGIKEVDEKLQQLRDSFNKVINPSATLVKELQELSRAGFTNEEILRGMYEAIIKAAKAEELMGRTIDAQLIPWLEQAKIIARNIELLEQLGKASGVGKGAAGAVFSGPFEEKQIEEAKKNAEIFIDLLKESVDANSEALKKMKEDTENATLSMIASWADFFGILGQNLDGSIGAVFDSLADGMTAYGNIQQKIFKEEKNMFGKSFTEASKWAAGIGAVFSSLGQKIDGIVGDILSGIGSIAMGFAQGGPWGAAIAAIGVGLNFLFKLFDKTEKKIQEIQKAAQALGFTISNDLAKALLEFAKSNAVDYTGALLANIDKLIAETPIAANNLEKYINLFSQALNTFAQGSTLALKVIKDLDAALPAMFEAATDSAGNLNMQMLAFIERLQAAKIEVKALTEFMTSQFSNAATALTGLLEGFGKGITDWASATKSDLRKAFEEFLPDKTQDEALKFFDKLVERGMSVGKILDILKTKFGFAPPLDFLLNFTKATITSRKEFEDFFVLVMAQINEMVAQGRSLPEIFQQLGGAMEILRDTAMELGLRSDPAFRSFFQLFRIMKSGAAEDLARVNTLLTSFHNLGILNAETFGALENIFIKTFNKFNENGKISRAEMTAMVPTLAQLRFMAQQYGFSLDAVTQAAIEAAIKQGLLSENIPIDPMTRLADLFEDRVIPVLEEVAAGLAAIAGFNGEQVNVGVNVDYTETGAVFDPNNPNIGGNIPKGKLNILSAQGIHEPVAFRVMSPEQYFVAHRDEKVRIEPSSTARNNNQGEYIIQSTHHHHISIGTRDLDEIITEDQEVGRIAPKVTYKRLQRNA